MEEARNSWQVAQELNIWTFMEVQGLHSMCPLPSPSVQVTNATSSLLLSQDLGEFTDQGQVKSSHFPLP